MTNIKAGVLSDTHISRPDSHFLQQVKHCFTDCDVIIHAGDLTDHSILEAFAGKTIHAVHGNMCANHCRQQLPETSLFELGKFTVGLTHGASLGYDIESALWDLFPEADCMIYGHTHRSSLNTIAGKLILNPGCFQTTSRYGAPGTYAILEAGEKLQAEIYEFSPQGSPAAGYASHRKHFF